MYSILHKCRVHVPGPGGPGGPGGAGGPGGGGGPGGAPMPGGGGAAGGEGGGGAPGPPIGGIPIIGGGAMGGGAGGGIGGPTGAGRGGERQDPMVYESEAHCQEYTYVHEVSRQRAKMITLTYELRNSFSPLLIPFIWY